MPSVRAVPSGPHSATVLKMGPLLLLLAASAMAAAQLHTETRMHFPIPIPAQQPHQCPPDEHYNDCLPGAIDPCPPQDCSRLYSKFDCSKVPRTCTRQCRCNGLLLRGPGGKCLTTLQCLNPSPLCPPDEHYDGCSPGTMEPCPPQNCSSLWSKFDCSKVSRVCKPQCRCNGQLWRNGAGKCVTTEQCINPTLLCPADEYYNDCPPGAVDPCPPQDCTSLGARYDCSKVSKKCTKQCRCKGNLLRNKDGKCVSVEECLHPTPRCPADEYYDDCPPGALEPCPPKDCTSLVARYDCTKVSKKCRKQCRCKGNLLRNKEGKCVPVDECFEPECGAYQEYSSCGSSCPDSCDNLHHPDRVCTAECVAGCFCVDGFVLDEQRCIPPNFCPTSPPKCGPDEEWDDCGSACPDSCDNINDPHRVCTDNCVPGCFCKEGLVLDDKGDCIMLEKCGKPPPKCGPNKVWSSCGSSCPDSCDNLDDPDRICTDQCVAGCFCTDGFVLNKNGDCVTPDKCAATNQCDAPHEEYRACGSACPDTCGNYHNPNRVCTLQCVRGCFCRKGYVRAGDGRCVEPRDCTPAKCPLNEEYKTCGTACPKTCKNKDIQINCIALCKEGCFCREGWVRNDDGLCVEPSKCPSTKCPANEEYKTCGTACPKTCKNKDSKIIICIDICRPGCFCKQGLVRNNDGLCVEPSKCTMPNQCDAPHEEYQECGSACPDTCDNYKDTNRICTRQCVRGCFCRKGYVRAGDGRCVEPGECPPTECNGDPHAEPGCQDCRKTCASLKDPPRQALPACPTVPGCKDRCACKAGYVKDETSDTCVLPERCPNINCGLNQQFDECAFNCTGTDYCRPPGQPPVPCSPPFICNGGCICKKGYKIDANGNCIREEDCPTIRCGPNQVPDGCAFNCSGTSYCRLPGQPPAPCSPPFICNLGCVCKKGYLIDANGYCIKEEDCLKCPANEVWSSCPAASCIHKRCSDLGKPIACPKIAPPCPGGCVCKQGWLRNSDGNCVPEEQCGCPKNETYNKCYYSCAPETCESRGKGYSCPNLNECQKGCRCNKGYLRDANGRCIKAEDCTCPENEYYNYCYYSCPPETCGTNGTYHCPLQDKQHCLEGCRCRKGYLRDSNGRCIKSEQCPSTTCPANEEYKKCKPRCVVERCDQMDDPPVCIPESPCVSGCACREGYLRDPKGTCVPKDKCPKLCANNEVYIFCGSPCPETCDNYNTTRAPCELRPTCVVGCYCKPGYVRNSSNKCVTKDQCASPKCGPNQVVSSCAFNCTSTDFCPVDDVAHFPCSPPFVCNVGCACQPGYKIDAAGNCIPPEDCPAVKCTRRNEVHNRCPSPCLAENCIDKDNQPTACNTFVKATCQPRCVCKKEFFRDRDGICVPKDQCPPVVKCPVDEVYVDCVAGQCRPKTCTELIHPAGCPGIRPPCPGGCLCREGLLRNAEGNCIPEEQCGCPKNQTFNKCFYLCPPNTCAAQGKDIVCPSTNKDYCEKGCECSKGYLRGYNRLCVKSEDCPRSCPTNETYSDCVQTCPPDSCAADGEVILCALNVDCKKGCRCSKGYRRNDRAMCVKTEECPPKQPPKCPPGETYKECGTACPATCANRGVEIRCTKNCVSGCFCPEGQIRDTVSGKCVEPSKCVGCGGDPYAVSGCSNYCGHTWTDYNIEGPHLCPLFCRVGGCACGEGRVYDESKKRCVLPKDCSNTCNGDQNAELVQCPNPCPATCELPKPRPCNRACIKEGCQCKAGYVIGPNKTCIKPDQCPGDQAHQCPTNETYVNCVVSCPTDYCPIGAGPDPACDPGFPCPGGCICKPGYKLQRYTKKKRCMLESDCPSRCPAGEMFKECGSACPPTCINGAQSPPCAEECVSGCFCPDHQLRDASGNCIDTDKCRGCGGDPNGVPGCSNYCGQTCADYKKPGGCPQACRVGGCACRDSYAYSPDTKKCIPAKDCPTPCPTNQTYVSCLVNCPTDYCPANDGPQPVCDPPPPQFCKAGCRCLPGYKLDRRSEKPRCILSSECPSIKCTRKHEKFAQCPAPCLRENCARILLSLCSGTGCGTPRCVCEPGYCRNDNGACVANGRPIIIIRPPPEE